MALSAHLLGLPSSARQESYPQREIAGILPWTCAFTTYVAVVAQVHPERVKDMLAYMRLVVETAQKFKEGRGWLTYDTAFRQNNQGPGARWDTLDSSLYAAYMGSQARACPQWSYVGTAQGPTIQPKAAPSQHSSLRQRLASRHASPRREDRGAPRGCCASCGIWGNAGSPGVATIGTFAQPVGTPTGLRTALAARPPAGRHDSPTGAWEETGARGGF